MSGGAEGRIGVAVWPAHVGVGSAPDERLPVERRGQIGWAMGGSGIVGAARVWVPKGEYQYLLYYSDLVSPPVAHGFFAQPLVMVADDWATIDNIENNDPLLTSPTGVAH